MRETSTLSRTTKLLGPAGTVVAAGLIVVLTCGTAFAYIRNGSGSGHGTASVASAQAIGFSVTGQSSASLYPGASGNVTVTLTNPYNQSITLTGISGSVSTNKGGCTNSDFTVATSPSGLPSSLTASQVVSGVVLTNAVTMNAGAADACRGAAITVTLSVTGRL